MLQRLQSDLGSLRLQSVEVGGIKFADCFTGKALLDWFLYAKESKTKEEARAIAVKLLYRGLLTLVTGAVPLLFAFTLLNFLLQLLPEKIYLEVW